MLAHDEQDHDAARLLTHFSSTSHSSNDSPNKARTSNYHHHRLEAENESAPSSGQGYARIISDSFIYTVMSAQCTFGRKLANSTVDIPWSESKSISRHLGTIRYNFASEYWEIVCEGKGGIIVDGLVLGKPTENGRTHYTAILHHKSKIEVGAVPAIFELCTAQVELEVEEDDDAGVQDDETVAVAAGAPLEGRIRIDHDDESVLLHQHQQMPALEDDEEDHEMIQTSHMAQNPIHQIPLNHSIMLPHVRSHQHHDPFVESYEHSVSPAATYGGLAGFHPPPAPLAHLAMSIDPEEHDGGDEQQEDEEVEYNEDDEGGEGEEGGGYDDDGDQNSQEDGSADVEFDPDGGGQRGGMVGATRGSKNGSKRVKKGTQKRIKLPGQPNLSYASLIAQALKSHPLGKMTVKEIYDFIMNAYPCFEKGSGGWQNSVRHNLSLNKAFKRVSRADGRKGAWWMVSPGTDHLFNGFVYIGGAVSRAQSAAHKKATSESQPRRRRSRATSRKRKNSVKGGESHASGSEEVATQHGEDDDEEGDHHQDNTLPSNLDGSGPSNTKIDLFPMLLEDGSVDGHGSTNLVIPAFRGGASITPFREAALNNTNSSSNNRGDKHNNSNNSKNMNAPPPLPPQQQSLPPSPLPQPQQTLPPILPPQSFVYPVLPTLPGPGELYHGFYSLNPPPFQSMTPTPASLNVTLPPPMDTEHPMTLPPIQLSPRGVGGQNVTNAAPTTAASTATIHMPHYRYHNEGGAVGEDLMSMPVVPSMTSAFAINPYN
ncbi:hypothetical protein SmJEL517_g00962 [Synchytrium microbalum]|uniref:Fork-head domain-containing protein n=1 Tax=Synchytrium microbalum TaxID=1806994 RepID=A0A507CGK5_9FUNG|nr:uncharacterized protein SmJEL517_g00962 [Synchytrium microbalum]TPX37114.1 hypothetical protein SmJEL517_g00962 [Synchytrium microbalum]